jgi:hypothetical protein
MAEKVTMATPPNDRSLMASDVDDRAPEPAPSDAAGAEAGFRQMREDHNLVALEN